MKKFISILLVGAMLFALCSCTSTSEKEQLTMGILDTVKSLDPIYASGDGEKIISANCFEGLLRLDSKGQIDLGGATAYSVSKDNLVYTFKLNPLAKWHITKATKAVMKEVGLSDFKNKITAEDYIFGIKRFIEAGNTHFNCIKGAKEYDPDDSPDIGVTAIDEHTLQITLVKKDPDFLYKLATLPVYPCEQVFCEALGNIHFSTPATIICNGPYYVDNVLETETVLKRNPSYTGKLQVHNQSVRLYNADKQNDLQKRFENGNCDMYLTTSDAPPEGDSTAFTAVNAVWGFAFNCKTAVGKTAELRSILLSTIDYDKIELPEFATEKADRIIPNNYLVGDSVYSDFSPQKISYAKNVKAAQANLDILLDRTDKEAYTVELAIPAPMENSMKKIIEYWETLFEDKILFDTRIFDIEDVSKIVSEGEYDLGILPVTPTDKTAFGMLAAFSGAPCNYKDKKLTAYTTKLKTTNQENAVLFGSAEKYLTDSGIFVPLFFTSSNLYLTNGLKGVYLADGGTLIYMHSGKKVQDK